MGDANPRPGISVFQAMLRDSARSQETGGAFPLATPEAAGPRNCGQSSGRSDPFWPRHGIAETTNSRQKTIARNIFIHCLGHEGTGYRSPSESNGDAIVRNVQPVNKRTTPFDPPTPILPRDKAGALAFTAFQYSVLVNEKRGSRQKRLPLFAV